MGLADRSRRAGLFLTGLVLGLGLFAGGVFLWGTRLQPDPSIPVLKTPAHSVGVIYLSPSNAPELWRAASDGSSARQLTQSGGRVYDFAVWPDGSQLIYSLANEWNGLSLWTMNRDGGDPKLLLDCGADRCFQPAVSPDNRVVAYSRKNSAENPGGEAGISRVWLIDTRNQSTSALYKDARITGTSPSWSPDGRFLSFYNPREGAIQIHPLSAGKDLLAPSRVEGVGGWSPDSKRMIYAGIIQNEDTSAGTLSQIDVPAGTIKTVLPNLAFIDFSEPVFSPDGSRIAVAARSPGELSARHIWIVGLDGQEEFSISEDPLQSQGGYQWEAQGPQDAMGARLVYQQLMPGSPGLPPDIFIYNLASRTSQKIAQDAFLPAWFPGGN